MTLFQLYTTRHIYISYRQSIIEDFARIFVPIQIHIIRGTVETI